MTRETYNKINEYSKTMLSDSAHDTEHVKRVLMLSLKIAKSEKNIDYDVLIASALLHDIGRYKQMEDKDICHAAFGSELAYEFILSLGWGEEKALHVKECVLTHRYRQDLKPKSIEAKIVFDADKIDVMGSLGVARSFMFIGATNSLMYSLNVNGEIENTKNTKNDSFFREYHKKLKNLDKLVHTKKAKEIARKRKNSLNVFYKTLRKEINYSYKQAKILDKILK